jgi:predicted TIM-barrel fold metal-dependent hydrolase
MAIRVEGHRQPPAPWPPGAEEVLREAARSGVPVIVRHEGKAWRYHVRLHGQDVVLRPFEEE